MEAKSLDDLPVIKDIHKLNGNTRISVAELAMVSYKICKDHARCELLGVLGTNGKTGDGQSPSIIYAGEPFRDEKGLHVHKMETEEIEVNKIDTYYTLVTQEERTLTKRG